MSGQVLLDGGSLNRNRSVRSKGVIPVRRIMLFFAFILGSTPMLFWGPMLTSASSGSRLKMFPTRLIPRLPLKRDAFPVMKGSRTLPSAS